MISKRKFAGIMVAVSAAAGFCGMAGATIFDGPATVTDSATAPGGTIIASNLPATGIIANSGTLNYYTNNYNGTPGETFTTGASSYSLNQLAIYVADAGNLSAETGNIHLDLGTVGAGNTYTLTNQYTGSAPGTVTNGNYLDFTLATPLALAPNTTYAYGVYDDNSNYMGPGLVTSGGIAGQQLITLGGGFGSGTANPNPTGSFSTWSGTGASAVSSTGTAGTNNAVFEAVGALGTPVPPVSPPGYTVYSNGLTVNNMGGVAPTPGPTDQANLNPTGTVGAASSGNPTGNTVNYYTNNGAPPGQTFTTGTAQAYTLNSITILDSDEHGGFADNASLAVSISTISNGKFTLVGVVTGTVPVGTSTATGDYIQLALNTPITLNGSSVYGYSISSNNGWSGLATDTNNDYTGGTLADFQLGSSSFGGTLVTSTVLPSSVFDVSLTAVPEPASLTILALAGGMLLLSRRRLLKTDGRAA